jgi:hypothetical protein
VIFWDSGAIKLVDATTPAEAARDCFMKDRRLKGFFFSFCSITSFFLKADLDSSFAFFIV